MNLRSLTVAMAVSIVASSVYASDRSERLTARGMAEFQAERYDAALLAFDQAVQADATDVNARYYRGLTHVRLNRLTAAIVDFRAVLLEQPDFADAALDLGSALVQTGAAEEAVPWLRRAQVDPELDAQASLFLGLAQLRLDDLAGARQSFQRAASDPSLTLSARYYEGVADYREGRTQQAQEKFAYVTNASPDSAIGREAAAFLDKLRQAPPAKSYRVYADVGLQYDSNVVLAPDDQAIKSSLAISQQADGVAVFSFGGAFIPWQNPQLQLVMGYDFFQSVYFTLNEFNLQDHRPSAQLAGAAWGVNFGLLGSYDYYRLEDESFLQDFTALPWLTIPEQGIGRTELFYRMRRRDFFDDPFSTLRDSFNHATGIRQVVNLGGAERYGAVGYQFDREDAVNSPGDEFAYDGHEVNAALGWLLPYAVGSEVAYGYRHESYAPESDGRRDDEHRVSVILEKWLTAYVGLGLGYLGAINDSTDEEFAYERHIVSLSVRARY